jgi:nitroreductase
MTEGEDKMTVTDVIKTRRNTKKFKPDPVETEQVTSWLEAASYAPNHRMVEPWEILIIGPETRASLNHKTNFGDAPFLFALLSQPAASPLARDENVIAAGCFAQNFLLTAHDAGLGVLWTSLGSTSQSRGILGVPEDYDVIGIFGVGYAAEVPDIKERTPITAKIKNLP